MTNVIAGVEDTHEGREALRYARQFADARGACLHVASVFADTIFVSSLAEIEASRESFFEIMLKVAEDELGVNFEFHRVVDDSVPAGLTRIAETVSADAMVIGSSHRGPSGRLLLGDAGSRLVTASPCAVVVSPRGWGRNGEMKIRRIGVAYDGLKESEAALEYGVGMARDLDASLLLIAAVPRILTPGRIGLTDPGYQEILHEDMEKTLQQVVADLGFEGVRKIVKTGFASDVLTEASADLDLLVLGSRSYGPIRRVLLGGTSVKVMRSAACPVVVVPRSSE